MPFKSVAQLRTCYTRRPKGWNCEEWLSKTNLCALPERERGTLTEKQVTRKKGQVPAKLGPLKTGSRGGKYREVRQGDCVRRIYYPR